MKHTEETKQKISDTKKGVPNLLNRKKNGKTEKFAGIRVTKENLKKLQNSAKDHGLSDSAFLVEAGLHF